MLKGITIALCGLVIFHSPAMARDTRSYDQRAMDRAAQQAAGASSLVTGVLRDGTDVCQQIGMSTSYDKARVHQDVDIEYREDPEREFRRYDRYRRSRYTNNDWRGSYYRPRTYYGPSHTVVDVETSGRRVIECE
ncbi:MAG: hypothetical protein RL538_299 [Candidatus Parcubacteria bacterium]|jgi:hypothetical protein